MTRPRESGPVPFRAVLLSGLALLAAVVGNVVFAGAPGSHETLLWLLAVVPAFLLAYHRGWGGVTGTLAVGMVLIVATEIGLRWTGQPPVDPLMLTGVVAAFLGICLGVGWLSGGLHRGRKRAEEKFQMLRDAVAHDLTATEEVERRERTLAAAVAQAAEIILILTPDGRTEYANPAIERITGYSVEDVIGSRPFEGPEGDGPPVLPRELWSPVREAEAVSRLVESRHREGSSLDLLATVSPLRDGRGGLQNILVMGHDVSEPLRVEEHMRRVQKMEELGTLTSGIAHDFNNILAVVLSSAELLTEELSHAQPQLLDIVEDVRKTAERGANLVRRLLLFSRTDPDPVEVLDVEHLLRDLESTVQRLITPRIRVRLSLPGPLPRVRLSPTALEQIVLNLATNARDAIADGGSFTVAAHTTTLLAEDREHHPWVVPGEYVVLRFEDTGAGMDAATRDRIFEPLFTTKASGEGTGLGMAVVYGLVKQHNGLVHVYSEPGEGTAISVYLPVAEDEAGTVGTQEDEAADTRATIPRGSGTVLVIEDEDAVRRATERALERLGYGVLVASDGEEGLAIFGDRGGEIDLVLSDLIMPGLSGRDVLHRLQGDGARVPFILMSGHGAIDREAGGSPGDVPWLRKPWSVLELATAVREAVDRG